ncbi:Dyp-type peroxidase [Microbacterium sediminicola]|uniref:Dyp-type peroxidase n=1 Tax=Microbacterium sediminicola TaxID=415210 RepID=A0ABP4U4Z5_9MICO
MVDERETRSDTAASTRRQFLVGGAAAGVGAAVGAAVALGVNHAATASTAPGSGAAPMNGAQVVPFYGEHQAGIDTSAQAHSTLVALDLLPEVTRDGLRRLMRILTDDAARLTQGTPALADSEPEMATAPARLTVTFAFGPEFVARSGATAPAWLRPLPAFSIDQLQDAYNDGDLLIQVASDDPVTVAHTVRMLLKDSRSFATVRWQQQGFRAAYGSYRPGTTMRNLFGQVDGTSNPQPGTENFDAVVWSDRGWLAGGTSLVVRRIRMTMDTWDELDRSGREQAVGRTMSNGAPLTGTEEFDEPDFDAKTAIGFPVIPEFSHMHRARGDDPRYPTEQIFRRGYNYDLPPSGAEVSDSGLIFVSYQADVDRQYVPIQQRLADLDLLNQWTIPIGSAVFAVPPGCAEGGYIGESILA